MVVAERLAKLILQITDARLYFHPINGRDVNSVRNRGRRKVVASVVEFFPGTQVVGNQPNNFLN